MEFAERRARIGTMAVASVRLILQVAGVGVEVEIVREQMRRAELEVGRVGLQVVKAPVELARPAEGVGTGWLRMVGATTGRSNAAE